MAEKTEAPKAEVAEHLALFPSEQGLGSILISPDVVARIAGLAVAEIEGVSLAGTGRGFSIANILPGKEPVKGIHVQKGETARYSIIAEVRMAYNTPMWETAQRLQRHIKDTVERMTNMELEAVDIRIVDIFIDRDREVED